MANSKLRIKGGYVYKHVARILANNKMTAREIMQTMKDEGRKDIPTVYELSNNMRGWKVPYTFVRRNEAGLWGPWNPDF